ncbi:MAG TPA: hypothetical protein VNP95_04720 [Thermomicrobiales bacterium]|nr:hypothetical protein [Thermomicrobiales bacterium]
MFDKLKDILASGTPEDAEQAATEATQAVENVKQEAQSVVDSASSATDSASVEDLTGAVSGLVDQLGGLEGVVGQLGGLSGLLDIAKQVDFPIGVDDLDPVLSKLGLSGSASSIVQGLVGQGIKQIDSPDDLINIAKQFLGK